jgi:hypothetical protein
MKITVLAARWLATGRRRACSGYLSNTMGSGCSSIRGTRSCRGSLSSCRRNSALEVGRQASRAGASRLVLTHLLPGTDPDASRAAAGRSSGEWIEVATGGLVAELD